MEYTSIKYIPTGNIFNMPTSDAEEILKTDRGNYEIVGGENIPEEKQEAEVTKTYDMVVEEEQKFTKTALKALNVKQLVELCKERDIKITEEDKKADLIEKLITEE